MGMRGIMFVLVFFTISLVYLAWSQIIESASESLIIRNAAAITQWVNSVSQTKFQVMYSFANCAPTKFHVLPCPILQTAFFTNQMLYIGIITGLLPYGTSDPSVQARIEKFQSFVVGRDTSIPWVGCKNLILLFP